MGGSGVEAKALGLADPLISPMLYLQRSQLSSQIKLVSQSPYITDKLPVEVIDSDLATCADPIGRSSRADTRAYTDLLVVVVPCT